MALNQEPVVQKKIPFLDLRVESDAERKELLSAIEQVLVHGRFILGPEVAELEKRVAAFCGRTYAVGVGSGTDALFLSLRCLGIGPGDEVITTSLSWIATANAIALTGATPVFADIGDDLNIDPASVEALVTPRTKALIPVHFTGKMCNMEALLTIADHHGLAVVEDAAQSFGASLAGRMSGSFGVLAALSLNPMKVFASCGEAGMVLTDRADLYERMLALRYNGMIDRRECIMPSLNGRLDTIQAAILLHRLTRLEDVIEKRRMHAAQYNKMLSQVVDVPTEHPEERAVYYTYTIKADQRDELQVFLEERGVETQIQHPILMPNQPAYRGWTRGMWSNAERLLSRVLCLPVHEKLAPEDLRYISNAVLAFYGEHLSAVRPGG